LAGVAVIAVVAAAVYYVMHLEGRAMIMLRIIILITCLHVLACPAFAFDYTPTPLTKSILDHDLVAVATVVASERGRCEIKISTVIKGTPPKQNLVLPAVWRPNEKWTYGSVELMKGAKYLLFLESKNGEYQLSSDFASYGVNKIKTDDAAIVGVVAILYRLLEAEDGKQQEQILAEVLRTEPEATKQRLMQAFYPWKNEATVPFLLKALESDGLRGWAHILIGRHGYRQPIPILIRHVREKRCPLAARTLGELKATEAFHALAEAACDEKLRRNRAWEIEALGKLEDKRAIPILVDCLEKHAAEMAVKNGVRWEEAAHAAKALGKMKAHEAVAPLIKLLKTELLLHDVGIAVFAALNDLGAAAEPALPVLEKIALDDKHTFAKDAANLIKKIKQEEKAKRE
jgi:hypothetical protein